MRQIYYNAKRTLEATKTRRRVLALLKDVEARRPEKTARRIRRMCKSNPTIAKRLGIGLQPILPLVVDSEARQKFMLEANKIMDEIKKGNLEKYHTERINGMLSKGDDEEPKDSAKKLMGLVTGKSQGGGA